MRLALVADVHGNLPALEAVVADLRTRQVEGVVNLGDCVSGPLWPRDTLALLRRLDWPTIRGNHDRWVGEDAPTSLSRTDAFAAEDVGADGRRWLAQLPASLVPTPGVVAIHACPEDDNAYLTEDVVDGRLVPARPDTVARRLGGIDAKKVVFSAHSHLATLLRLPDGRRLVNPGSVGCPAYADPTPPAHVSESLSPDARYAIVALDMTEGATALGRVELIATPYDHAAAARRAASLDRPDWAHALAHGAMAKDTP